MENKKIIQIIAIENTASIQSSVLALDEEGNTYRLYEGVWVMFIRHGLNRQ